MLKNKAELENSSHHHVSPVDSGQVRPEKPGTTMNAKKLKPAPEAENKEENKSSQVTKGGFRINPDGRYTGFVYHCRKEQKNVRYGTKQGWPSNVFTHEDAMREKGKALARVDVKMTEAAKRIEWQHRYEDMDELYEEFIQWIEKEKKPATVQSYRSNMKNYVYPFFLTEQGLNNLELWPKKYEEYKEYLEKISPLKISKRLSTNSRNNCIKVLNTFLTFLEKKHKKGPFPRCEEFLTTADDRRGLKDIFSEDEQQKLFAHATQGACPSFS